jgi:hypothetical protein
VSSEEDCHVYNRMGIEPLNPRFKDLLRSCRDGSIVVVPPVSLSASMSAEQTLVFTLDSDLHDDIIDSLEYDDNSAFCEEEPAEREDAFDSEEARQHAELMQEESRLHFVGALRHSQRERAPIRDYYQEARMREFGYGNLPPS